MNINAQMLDPPPIYDAPPNYEEAILMFPDNTHDSFMGYQHEVSSTTWAKQPLCSRV